MSVRAELVRLGLRWFVKRKIGPATTLEALRRQDAFLERLVCQRIQSVAPTGRRTIKPEPLPGSLVTVTSPPIMRASLRVIARPRPVPP